VRFDDAPPKDHDDGQTDRHLSVSHVELHEAMGAGWKVYGLCSMGAIRASKTHHMGMLPLGRVAQMFCDDANFADNEGRPRARLGSAVRVAVGTDD
jgi:hypothetical protein